MDIRQSSAYAEFIRKIGWKVEKVGKWHAFIKNFPLLGSFIKIQRIKKPIPWKEIKSLSQKHRAFKVLIEPDVNQKTENRKQGRGKRIKRPYLPTKTVQIDLSKNEESLFADFSKKTRWAIRQATKNKLKVFESDKIEPFIKLKLPQMFPLGFLIKKEIKSLWHTLSLNHASLLTAKDFNNTYYRSEILAGVLLLFYDKKAYYWLAASSKEGNNLSAPSLLVWKAIKLSKKRGCKVFDFEGIYDERFPKATKTWRGFTRFKMGFGGEIVEYPSPFIVAKGDR